MKIVTFQYFDKYMNEPMAITTRYKIEVHNLGKNLKASWFFMKGHLHLI
ncbi:hypothetical protein B835_1418 [Enterococcus mundtii 3F]|nr:hypothetical protein [Enterococcus mundtii 3F]